MTLRKSYLSVSGPGGEDMLRSWGSALIGVRIVDRQDGESDENHLHVHAQTALHADPRPGEAVFRKDRLVQEQRGPDGPVHVPTRAYLRRAATGSQLHLICRAADLGDAMLMQFDSQHFDGGNGHKTLSDVFKGVFNGGTVLIHPDIAKMPVQACYVLRWRQSAIDFATGLADSVGALVKPMDGKILILKRGSLQSVSGQTLPTIVIPFREDYGLTSPPIRIKRRQSRLRTRRRPRSRASQAVRALPASSRL